MVFILDEGSLFELSFDKLWDYLPSEKHAHPVAKLISREISGNVLTIASDRDINGKIVRTKLRMTIFPPLGVVQEYLEGPAAGSKAFLYYYPVGNKTGITVVGDFTISGTSDDESTRRAVAQMMERSFTEDEAIIRRVYP
jgi:hypothetical protein